MAMQDTERRPPLTVRAAATYSGLTEGYLNKRRVSGDGPMFLKIGGRVLYKPDDLDAWLDAHKRRSTSEQAA